MNRQFSTAWTVHPFLTDRSIPYVIIGGLAVQRWGNPRFTRDVDVTVLLPPGKEEPLLREIIAVFPPRGPEGVSFALANRVLLVRVPGGSEVDISLGLPGYEESVVARAVPHDLGEERVVQLCSAEDLLIHKCLAGRAIDVLDIEGIVVRQHESLDVDYIRRWLWTFAGLTDDPEVPQQFERAWAQRAS